MKFQFYPSDIKCSEPIGEITLDKFLNAIKNPKTHIRNTFEMIRIADERGDMATKHALKESLYSFTPCVFVNGSRKYVNIKNWTGLLVLDFDKLDDQYAKEWKAALFNEYSFVIAAWLSASHRGVRALVKIPEVHSVGEFKEHFNALEKKLSIYRGWDHAPNNCILPCFLSYDFDLLQRKDATTLTERYSPPIPPPVKQYIVTDKSTTIEKIIASALNKITDAGHPILRATAYALGGYSGAGYIDEDSALMMIEKMIDGNAYLSQKAPVYKKTAKEMILKGRTQPLYLKDGK